MAEPFYYLSAEDVVPRDVVHVIIGGSVTVVPPRTFEGCHNLTRLELQEGVEEIGRGVFHDCLNLTHIKCPSSLHTFGDGAFAGCERVSDVVLQVTVVPPRTFEGAKFLARVELLEGVVEIGSKAFRDCPNLERVDCPSSLRTIDDEAFASCPRLSEVNLREGLQRIGTRAFRKCGLERIAVPSSVVDIRERAFCWCSRLSEVNLREGLRWIGTMAFFRCALRRIAVPSSVVEIGEDAFARCRKLEAATLAGGMVMLARGAFNCPRLERIALSSVAIVVEAGEDGNGRVAAATGGIEWDPTNRVILVASPHLTTNGSPQLVLASPHLELMLPEELSNLTDAIGRIADATLGAGPLDLADGDVSGRIRGGFTDHLSAWYTSYKTEVATILELVVWKIELSRAREASKGRAVGGGRQRRRTSRPETTADALVARTPSSSSFYPLSPARIVAWTKGKMQDRSNPEEECLPLSPGSTPTVNGVEYGRLIVENIQKRIQSISRGASRQEAALFVFIHELTQEILFY